MRRMVVALLMAVLAVPPALATDEEIIALSAQADQAFAEGRYEDADAAAEAAWRQAEMEWGAVEDTAFLADNLARQRLLFGQRAQAREPAGRVLELAEAGLTPSIRAEEARLAVAISGFDPAAPTAEAVAVLRAALQAAEEAGIAPGQLLWSGWLDVARGELQLGAFDDAQQAGQNVMNIMDLAAGVPDSARVEAGVIAGNAAWQLRDFATSTNSYSWALTHIPQRIDRDGERILNPSWATLAAWSGLANAVADSRNQVDEVDRAGDLFGLDDMSAEIICPALRTASERQAPEYPSEALRAGRLGYAIVEYEIGADGRPQEIDIVASIPDETFGQAMLEAVQRWRYEPESVADCTGVNLVTHVEFWLPTSMPRLTRRPPRD